MPRVALRFYRERSPRDGAERLSELASRPVEPAAIDPLALAKLLLGSFPGRAEETPYVGIGARLEEPIVEDPVEPEARTAEDAARALRRAIERAVRRAIAGARRVAVLTGGGLDSGALLAIAEAAARETNASVFAVALDYAAEGDDRPHLRALEERLRCEVVRLAPEDAAARAALLDGVDAAPFTSALGALEVEAHARARSGGADVVLTGAGGDDLFDGDPRALGALALAGQPALAVRTARRLRNVGWTRRPWWSWVARPILVPFVPRAVRSWRAHHARRRLPAWAGPRLARAMADVWARAAGAWDEELRGGPSGERPLLEKEPTRLSRTSWAWYRHQLEIGSGCVRIDPYLDPALIQTVQRLPPWWLLHGGIRRGLFREAVRGLIPEALRTREDKAGFEPAIARFVAAIGGLDALGELGAAPRLAGAGFVEPRAFAPVLASIRADPARSAAWSEVWPVLAVEAFLRAAPGYAIGPGT